MRGAADAVVLPVVAAFTLFLFIAHFDTCRTREDSVEGDILTVTTLKGRLPQPIVTYFDVTIDLDDGRVVICPIHSQRYGSTLYRLYQKRTPEMPLLRERVRVVVGRHSGLTVCRGLAVRTEKGDGQ